ncbi:hypothetical protein H7X46_23375 [Pseudonocardia sp. C8]|uniref:DUF3039 domain-containing protein n=1 Tax=Saccharopolyspora cebuensis TaxID=418759 RepID=A0ABV4CSW1_9PSEU|nr:hypothetical protein [Pseudonocardia sp. C8]MBC3194001.1 hypothetical protein [Pseudonocardia sp. C8]
MTSGKPVTMPYVMNGPLGQHQIVMPSLCANEYLVPPRFDEGEPTEPVCVECRDRLAALQDDRTSLRLRTTAPVSTPA